MAGFLEGYGEGEEQRAKIVWRTLAAVLAVMVIAAALYFTFRGYSQKKQVARFLELLQRQDYPSAYQLWGCTPQNPCRDYSLARFMDDWGPKSPRSNFAGAQVKKTRYCGQGVITVLDFGKGEETLLWVESKDLTIGFAPWPVCNPMYKPVTQ